MNWINFVIFFLTISFINSEPNLDKSEGDVAKTKCREQIEEALQKYWNQDQVNNVKKNLNDKNILLNDEEGDQDNENEGNGVNAKCKGKACDGKDQKNSARKKDTINKMQIKKLSNFGLSKANTKTKSESSSSKVADNAEAVKISLNAVKKVEAVKQSLKVNKKTETVKPNLKNNQKSDSINNNNVNKIGKTESVKSVTKTESKQDLNGHCLDENKDGLCNEKVIVKKSHNPTHFSLSQDLYNDNDEDEDDDQSSKENINAHSHIDEILKLDKIGSKEDLAEQSLILSIFRDLKRIYETSIKPLEELYKYKEITTRLISDAEIFSKPLVLIMGPKGSGKTTLVNYLLGLQSTPWQLNTGLSASYPHYTIIMQGETFTKLSPTELSADFAFSSLQQFGQNFLEYHLQAYKMPLDILQKMTIVDCPGLVEGLSLGKSLETAKPIDSEVYQWFIDRCDVIYIVLDVGQLHLISNLRQLLEQLKGRDVRFVVSKSETVEHSELITLIGQLLWLLSPLMSADQPPQVYALSANTLSHYDAFIDNQEQAWLEDLSQQVSGLARVESHIAEIRRHAVRVRNHAKVIDCYLATFYKNKGLFTFGSSSRKLASEITENPQEYRIFSGTVAGQGTNVSRYDLPDPSIYKEFFRTYSLIDFKPLSATCSFFKGCPIDKLDVAIAYHLPDLITKYKKFTKTKE